jgi:hypothetical protein
MGRNYLKGRDGDRINAVLAAAGYNFGLLLRWLKALLRALIQALLATRFFTDDYSLCAILSVARKLLATMVRLGLIPPLDGKNDASRT